jgi:hypothetical protein
VFWRTRSLACEMKKHDELVTTGSLETTQHSPHEWFYGLFRDLPGDRALLSPSPRNAKHCRELMPASRHQDHTASPSASYHSSKIHQRPSHPAPNVRDDRETPLLSGAGRPKLVAVICPTAQAEFFKPARPIGTTGKSVATMKILSIASFSVPDAMQRVTLLRRAGTNVKDQETAER